MENKLIYVQYSRKSSESREKQALSIDEQKEECVKLEKLLDLNIPYKLEESRSAYKPDNRPEFDKLISLIEAGKVNAILTWKPDRLCRNPKEGGYLLQLLQGGVLKEIRCADGETYTQDSDHLILQIHFGMANQYSRNLSKNVKRGNSYKFLNNKQWLGPAKPGYLNAQEGKDKTIVVDEERYPIIEKAIRLILSGTHTPMEALNVLNKKFGYRSRKTKCQGGKPMHKSGWYRYLSDPYLYGLMKRKEGEVMGDFKPMLSKPEFDRLQIRLGRRGTRISKHEIPYRDVLKCGSCGGTVCGDDKWQVYCPACKEKFHKGKNTTECKYCHTPIERMKNPTILHYVYLFCTKNKNPNCTQKIISVKDFEKLVDDELLKFTIPDSFRDWAIKHLNNCNTKEVGDREIVRTNLKTAYDDCVKKLDSLLSLKISPQNIDGSVISDEEYNTKRKTLLDEKTSLLEQINGVDKRQNDWMELSERTFDFAVYARHWLEHGDAKQKSSILAALGSNIRIMDKKLLITRHKQYFLIEKGVGEIKQLARQFEPGKTPVLSEHLLSFEPIRSAWLGD
ncbi:hypothetical protein A3A76_01285 [Candidatus Woesebacteria bacterium RIFCSPLOWO2_01_FULL_39_23]|uniref:Resolvase/invertase-type recombinase catalytic domain-containing protein n=1 Tax=Candidatus Woesebacteria bacterium RIFCSPHIGHO2_01_FULL_40_22 TaxID=1802499 RepID=A0A1F7YH14_9BACT|nr:MAG: hypothetical protein A2141_05085 [Candidatus Woesebacteria bacterium RBG_16_40_11]OGM26460.1 MAG: hypothetical protein A2628_02880 [Candidatus Woesebacteria bacterium RIFCSPHIGHO2_01_FULL_40_22]OGM37629.1 MAG: hypothetical protein A3E41_05395 [Candidatus Woesebacteria bacterium RIFCSPHIGHO2_12_FULL_38_9]OGM62913.1 MAG: hypothetical protein A3A76_01285 [Candidatus Woesebacteria bacterium RIFCSPLOWO2_01_FULL_39_23]